MFSNLTEGLSRVFKNLSGQGRLTEDNIKEPLREVRLALLEADVALPVIKEFLDEVRVKVLGLNEQQNLTPSEALQQKNITPSQAFVKIVHDELVKLMGEVNETLSLNVQPPAIILMAGLQGSGKTTTVAKLARWLSESQKKSVMVTSTDIYRPAAIKQLETLANEVNVQFFPSDIHQKPEFIAQQAIQTAKQKLVDVLIIDTAGRLHIDAEMMAEIKSLHAVTNPVETLFVVDSMTGQDAANTAREFHEALPLTGVVLTKTDGDARGGAALSIRKITGKPIKFIGVGEKVDALQPFYPDRIASRILGMGDILSLVEEAERKIDRKKAEKIAQKISKGKGFDLEDYRDQILQMGNMGGLAGLMDKIPGMSAIPAAAKAQVNDQVLGKTLAIINSMTPKERRYPAVINGSRKRRIAIGSGTQIQDINRLLKQFEQMQKMMKKMSSRGGMLKMMRGLKNILPGGNFPIMK